MKKIGIITNIKFSELSKNFHKTDIIKFVNNVYNNFITQGKLLKSEIILISTGNPWIEHVPISLFLLNEQNKDELDNKYAGLELCVPTCINYKTKKFLNTHEGRKLNEIHENYKLISNIDTLEELSKNIQPNKSNKTNKKTFIKRGFKQAKTMMINNCDIILVFGFDNLPDTELWNKITCDKYYYSMSSFL